MVITPGKNFIGQEGFPTPSDVPSDTACRSFVLPDNDEWFGLLMGAVELLLNPHNYFNYGALSIDDTVDAWQLIIQDAYDRSLVGTCDPTIPAPWWDEDSADDADDEEAALTQTWYGEIVESSALIMSETVELTFLDNLGIWAIAGFIAYAGLPGAALAFVPVAKKFVLAFKQHDLGGIVKVLFDFLEVAEIDTYGVGDAVLNLPIIAPDDDETHTLYVMMSDEHNPAITGTPNIQILRKRLSEAEFSNPDSRYDSECDCIQITTDDGTTWVDASGFDPRHADAFRRPALTGGDANCNAAAGMVKWIHDFVDQCIEILGAGSAITAIANLALKFFDFLFPAADFVTLILSIAGAIFDIGYTALTAAFTTTEYDLLLCIFYCNVDASGQVSATKLAHIESQITSQLNTTAALVVNAILFIQGEVGLSNAGVFEALTGQDCSACACEWCYTFDFTASDGGWHVLTGAPGTYSAGVGWIGTYVSPTNISSLRIAIDFTTTVISQYEVTYSVAGPGSMEGTGFLRLRDSGATVFSGDVDGNPGTYTHHFDTSGNADAAWAGSDSASDQTITRITLHGLGTNPFGDDNC